MRELPPHVGIVGLGLIGGSLARDLLSRGTRVTGFDRNASALGDVAGEAPDRIRVVNSVAEVMAAPFVVIAVPVGVALDVLADLAPCVTPEHVVIDVGSTKRDIVARADALGIGARFVGCHPLAGDHRSGWAASRAGLFDGAPVFICPGPNTEAAPYNSARRFWEALGAIVETLAPDAHDRRMALVSHLPHMVSVALALTLRDAGVSPGALGPGGRDATRLAGGSVEIWSEIVAQNRESLARALALFEEDIQALRCALEAGDATALSARFNDARDWRSA